MTTSIEQNNANAGTLSCGCEHSHENTATPARLFGILLGGALILNSFFAELIYESNIPEHKQVIAPLCAFIGAIFLAAPLVFDAIKNFWSGKLFMGELAALAVLACFAIGKYQEAGLVAFVLLLAELLESRTALGAKAAVEDLIRLTPTTACRVRNNVEEEVAVTNLAVGDLVRVRPGENIPTDGVIREGMTTLNEASVTGESLPVDKSKDSNVFAGTVNLTGAIVLEVTRVGEDTTLGKVRSLILQAEATRLPVSRLIDQHVQWYTPAILMIAIVILYFTKNVGFAITALVVACPCALVLATPTAMVAALTAASRVGILIKNVAHLELAGSLDAVLFDKTGTLTTGELSVYRLSPADGVEPAHLLRMAASADRYSNHPVARALIKVANEAKIELAAPEDFEEVGGQGVKAKIDHYQVIAGRGSWLQSNHVIGVKEEGSEGEGFSTLHVSANGVWLGWIGLVDRTRPEARHTTDELRACGINHITMLTGDRWGVARRVAGELGCTDVAAECLPERKLEIVEGLRKRGLKVAVVGDGVNDAPALAAGDLGIAMGVAGNDVAIHSASIALMSSDLRRLPFLVRLSRHTRRIVFINLLLGVFFVVAGLIASGLGYLTPVVAAVFHLISSLFVIFNSARIVRFGEDTPSHNAASSS